MEDCECDGPMKTFLGVLEQLVASPISYFHINVQNDSHQDLQYGITNAFNNGESGVNQVQSDNILSCSLETLYFAIGCH
jgi:hypothetical protein